MNLIKAQVKKVSVVILMGVLLFQVINTPISALEKQDTILVNGVAIPFSKEVGEPILIDERTYVPLRMMADQLGYETKWNSEYQQATISNKHQTIQLIINCSQAVVDGVPVQATPALLLNQKTYVPLRFVTERLECEVVFKEGVTYLTTTLKDEETLSPWDYQKQLGQGMDVDWCKTIQGRANYTEATVKAFKEKGIKHVRIRIKDEATEELLQDLDEQIEDCLKYGIMPIIAYQADEFKNTPTEKNIQKVIGWWETIAERYQEVSPLLSFDLIIEATDALNKDPDKLNEIYERLVSKIRKTNPTRIIMISPRLRSDAAYLKELKIPTTHNGYLMAEWHFYAAGPSKDNDRKLWTTGTEAEKALIDEKISLALEWQTQTGIPTWVGSWMPGNYNDGDDYTIEEQVGFASYMKQALNQANIPFAVNSDTKFYNREINEWVEEMEPVRKCIWGY